MPLGEMRCCLPSVPKRLWLFRLFDNTAGDAVAGVAGWIGLLIVGLGVDYERQAAIAEDRMGTVGPGEVFGFGTQADLPVSADRDVGVVASMVAFRIFQSMFLPIGIEVRSG